MKALIIAGGRGSRLGTLTENVNKCMLMFKNKPIIEYSLEIIDSLNISEIIIAAGYKAEEIINYYGNNYKNKKITYSMDKPQTKGIVSAIDNAKELIGQEDFILMLGDEIMQNSRHYSMLDLFIKDDIFCLCGMVKEEDKEKIKKTYTISVEGNNINYLIEKPISPLNNLMGTGNIIFKNEILSLIDEVQINPKRQEKDLVDLINRAIKKDKIVKYDIICEKYLNINTIEEFKC